MNTSSNVDRQKIIDEMHRRTIAVIGTRQGIQAVPKHIGRSVYNRQGELVTFWLEPLNKKLELTETNKP